MHMFLNSFPFLSLLLFTSSAECQSSDWNSGHKLKCKVFKSTDSSPVRKDDLGLKASLLASIHVFSIFVCVICTFKHMYATLF